MSRTYKDKPHRVRLRENMERGLIDHDHRETPAREGLSWLPDRNLTVTYYKWAQKEIHEYRLYLNSLEAIEYEEVESEGAFIRNPLTRTEAGDYYFEPGHREPKTIRFEVRHAYTYPGRDGRCAADEYDELIPSWKQTCTPRWTRDLNRRRRGGKNRYSRAQVRAALDVTRGLANADHLDPAYSDPVLEEPYGPKVWTWDD